MANDTPVSKKYRILKNENTDTWDRISFWTKGSDVHFNDDSTAQSLKPTNTLRRNISYSIGDVAFEKTASSNYMLYCEVAGTTAATTPSGYASATRGILITDGTAKFRVYDIIPLSIIMSEECTVPSLSVVDDLKSKLVASDDTNFYFGKYREKYGFFTSADREPTSFHNFKYGYTKYETSLSISVNITSGSSKAVNLEAPSGYKWSEIWIIQILGNSINHPFYIYYKCPYGDGTYMAGWLNEDDTDKLRITSINNTTTSVTFKNNDSTTRTVTPCCIWGYLESV